MMSDFVCNECGLVHGYQECKTVNGRIAAKLARLLCEDTCGRAGLDASLPCDDHCEQAERLARPTVALLDGLLARIEANEPTEFFLAAGALKDALSRPERGAPDVSLAATPPSEDWSHADCEVCKAARRAPRDMTTAGETAAGDLRNAQMILAAARRDVALMFPKTSAIAQDLDAVARLVGAALQKLEAK